ncbi:MAG: ABC transporter permease [Sedimentisphaeraceae bacterium JB056]
MFYRITRIISLGAKSLWMHKLRSVLTALGIIFGVSSVISMLAIGEGASKDAQERIARLGSRNIIIKTVKPPDSQKNDGTQETMLEYGLRYEDADRFRNTIPDVDIVIPVRRNNAQSSYLNKRVSVEIVGTVSWYPEMSPVNIIAGRFLAPIDVEYVQPVCVVDSGVVEKLFGFDDPLEQNIKINGSYYKVIGIATTADSASDANGSGNGGGFAGSIYVPITTSKARFGETEVQIGGTGLNSEKVELQDITVKVESIQDVLPVRNIIADLLKRFHKKEDYQIIVPLELLREAEETKRIFNIVLGSIAAISLIVGGIGIMNIMLATVSERTREIGIRRALGAKKHDIVVQFLSETVMLTLTGGLLGIILGLIIPLFVTHFGNMPTIIKPAALILAFGISAIIGVTFGIYPAYRAANMDPIESLRHE